MIARLLETKLRMAFGGLKSSQDDRLRAPLFTVLSLFFCMSLYRSTYWLSLNVRALEPVGELLVQKLIAITFMMFLGLLLFSSLVAVFGALYLADDLEFLMAHPIPNDDMFCSRFIEAMVQSSWVILLFAMPPFIAVGQANGAPWLYYLMLPGVFIPFVAIPTAIATIIALTLSNALIASRMRDSMMFLGLVAIGLLFAVIRVMQPERLLNPKSFESIGEIMALLSTPKSSMLPSDWAVNILIPLLFGSGEVDGWSAALLYSTAIALFFIATWLHRKFYIRGYSRAQEGRHGKSLLMHLRDWHLERSTAKAGSLEERFDQIGQTPGTFTALGQLILKDRIIFTRDAGQWSNILVIISLMTIYLVNYKHFSSYSDIKLVGDVGLYFFNLAVCGFVVMALSGRFLYPAISLEGRSFWLMLQAPISLEKMLVGKWLGAMLPVVFVGQFMIWLSNLLVLQTWFYMIAGCLVVLMMTLTVAAMAVGFGALYPQFHNPNPASIASSFGAVIFMLLSIGYVMMTLLGLFRILYVIGNFFEKGAAINLYWFDYTGAAFSVLLSAAVIWISIKIGAASLRRRL